MVFTMVTALRALGGKIFNEFSHDKICPDNYNSKGLGELIDLSMEITKICHITSQMILTRSNKVFQF